VPGLPWQWTTGPCMHATFQHPPISMVRFIEPARAADLTLSFGRRPHAAFLLSNFPATNTATISMPSTT
jgi:hypothetical protein